MSNQIEEAKELLKKNGYSVANLWHKSDVQGYYECTDEQAQEVLYQALNNETSMEQIWFALHFHSKENELAEVNKCLIINFADRPKNLDIICNKYETMASEGGLTYEDCANYKSEVEKIGYTLDYGLDSEPCNLLKID